ncbi:MAG: GEVED domain-containing protein [Hymenobacter sp.]
MGNTRMRVVVSNNGNAANACATFQGEAEVEDYPVNAAQPLAAREALALAALTVSPNPSPDGRLQIRVSEPWPRRPLRPGGAEPAGRAPASPAACA